MPSEVIFEFCITDGLPPELHDELWSEYTHRALTLMSPSLVIVSRPVAWRPEGQGHTRYGFLVPWLDEAKANGASDNCSYVRPETEEEHDHGR